MGSARGGSNPSAVARVCVCYKLLCYELCERVSIESHTELELYAWMAEWSKAVDLSSILFVGVGSNPTSGIINIFVSRVT